MASISFARFATLLLLLLLVPLCGLAAVNVTQTEPRRYTDIGYGHSDMNRNLSVLERHLKAEGARCLRAGENLDLQVFDVDLAGRDEWWHRPGQDLRVMREVTWPRIELGYIWRDARGTVIDEGREWVTDMDYLQHSAIARTEIDSLAYEKRMLRDWFAGKCDRREGHAAR